METIRDVICKNFNRLIESSDLSNKTIAADAGVTEPTFYRWKSGESTPELPNIEALAKALGVDPFEFYRTDEPRKNIRSFKIKDISKFLESIPDEIYEMAQDLGHDHQVWEVVKGAHDQLMKSKKAKEGKGKSA